MAGWTRFVQGLTTVFNVAGTALQRRDGIQFGEGLSTTDDGTKTVVVADSVGGGISGQRVLFDDFVGCEDVAATGVTLSALSDLRWSVKNTSGFVNGVPTGGALGHNPNMQGVVNPASGFTGETGICLPGRTNVARMLPVNRIESLSFMFTFAIPVGTEEISMGLTEQLVSAADMANAGNGVTIRLRKGASNFFQGRVLNGGSEDSNNTSAVNPTIGVDQAVSFVKIEQQQNGTTGFGSNLWNFYAGSSATPFASGIAGPTAWTGNEQITAYFVCRGGNTQAVIDSAELIFFPQTLAQRLAAP